MNTHLPDNSRIWIYQSQTLLSAEVQSQLTVEIKRFVGQWAAHGEELHGDAFILENYFIVLAIDESKVGASGCSIDSSTRFIKEIEKKYNLSLLNRINVLTEINGVKEIIHFSDVNKEEDRIIFNPMIRTVGELKNNWKIEAKDWTF